MSVFEQIVHSGGGPKPFGAMTLADVSERAGELRAVGAGGGPLARVIPVAQAWGELARTMTSEGVATVAELGEAAAAERAGRLWVVPPGGTLLPDSEP